MNYKTKGVVLIINLKMDNYEAADIAVKVDVSKLTQSLEDCGYYVIKKLNMKNNEECMKELDDVKQLPEVYNAKKFILFDLTPSTNAQRALNGEIIRSFNYYKCKSLGEKPKIFFFQSYSDYCNFPSQTDNVQPSKETNTATDSKSIYIPEYSDIILAFMDTAGKEIPLREPKEGSFFIEAIYKSLNEACNETSETNKDLESILKKVARYLKSKDAYGYPVFIYENWGLGETIYL